ncbi:MAG: ROK family protein [Phycisphaeraceae bacterium]|nr:ROK family protein [Phycisphaerales bacterium]QOJ17425.1 MAG: ROK family protein [Phycisphaeraceae bacterium]
MPKRARTRLSNPVVGVDLGGTNMQLGVVDRHNHIHGRLKLKTKAAEGAKSVIERLARGVEESCEQAGIKVTDLKAVGVAAAGAIDIPKGVVLNAPNLGWIDLPFRDILRKRLGVPVVLENDVNGAVWGEYVLGKTAGQGDVLGIWVGTGVGGGLVLNGRIYHGAFFTAGEVGHTILDVREPWGQSKLEEICSRTGMSRMIVSRLHAYPKSVLHKLIDPATGVAGSKVLAQAYKRRDPLTVDVVNTAADLLGVAIASFVTLLALDTVIVGGGVTEALGEPYLKRIRASFDRHVFPDVCRGCRIIPTELVDNAGLLGAALLAREERRGERAGKR